MRHKNNTLQLSRELTYISFGWLLLGVTMGSVLDSIVPRGTMESMGIYTSYTSHVEERSLFLLAVLVSLGLFPVIVVLMKKYGFYSEILGRGGKMFLIFLAFISFPFALDVIPVASTTKYYKVIFALTSHWDWFGALLIIYIYLWVTAFLISAATTTGRDYDRKRSNT